MDVLEVYASKIENTIRRFKWDKLQRLYGSIHNSIIGFISTEWITLSEKNSVLDGAPNIEDDDGKKYADLLLCEEDKPFIVVEVESSVSKYREKIDTIFRYLNNKEFEGPVFGMMVMSNVNETQHGMNCRHHWDQIKAIVTQEGKPIVLVSIEKDKAKLDKSPLSRLRKRNKYYPWNIVNIEYWIHTPNQTKEGKLLDISKKEYTSTGGIGNE